MNKQILNIINFQILYEILDEIKDNLFFEVVNYKDRNDFSTNNKIDLKQTLIITKENNVNNFPDINLLFVKSFPISLSKLIELINIQLLKIRFNSQSNVKIKDYDLDLNSKFLSKNQVNLKLTEREVEIILYLSSNKAKHKVLDLQKNIWKYSSDLETHTVETHIYRLRKKIDDKFSDKNFILSHNDGYFIE